MHLIELIESTFFNEDQATLWLNQPKELYCSSLVDFIMTIRHQLISLPEYSSLKQKILPELIKTCLDNSRVIICTLNELPIIQPGCDFLIIDDAHLLSECQVFQGLMSHPKRLILSGCHQTCFGQRV